MYRTVGSPEWQDEKCTKIRKEALAAGSTPEELDGGESRGFCWMPWADFAAFFDTMTGAWFALALSLTYGCVYN